VLGILSALLVGVAVYVAAIVTANTFATVVAGRTRRIALLRLIGASARSQRAEIARMPEYDERIVLKSWPGKTMHLLFPRYYRVLDEAGNTLVSASALWALVDQQTRRMVFPDRYGVVIEGEKTGREIALPSPPPRAKEGPVSAFTVPYSYVDLNGHMNNTRYFDLAEDRIKSAAEGRPLRSIAVEYANEARLGDELRVTVEHEGCVYRVSGDTEKKIFRMEFVYQ
jgi:acyl-ACP thioesterase